MNTNEFKKLVTEHFSPKIRELGWKGSGFHYRRLEENHIVKIFGIQGMWYGGSVDCKTAIHFDFIPDLAGLPFNKSTYASCLIRKQLTPNGEGGYQWKLSDDLEKNIESVYSIWYAFEKHGETFYRDFADFPHPFDQITPQDLESSNNYRILGKYHISNSIEFANLLKEINLLIGNKVVAKEFSQIGIDRTKELGKKLWVGRKTKSYRETEKFIELQIEKLTIK